MPASEGAIDRMPIVDIRGHHAPLASCLVDGENAVDDAAELRGLPPRATRAPLACGQWELEDVPLRITDIFRIVTYGAHHRDSFPGLCVGSSVTS